MFFLGSSPITWLCKKQHAHTHSSIEDKYSSTVLASQEILWLCQLITMFGFPPHHPTILWCDNQSAIHISHNLVEHQHTKHIELHMHFIRQLIQDGILSLEYIPTDAHDVDIFTKPLTSPHCL